MPSATAPGPISSRSSEADSLPSPLTTEPTASSVSDGRTAEISPAARSAKSAFCCVAISVITVPSKQIRQDAPHAEDAGRPPDSLRPEPRQPCGGEFEAQSENRPAELFSGRAVKHERPTSIRSTPHGEALITTLRDQG